MSDKNYESGILKKYEYILKDSEFLKLKNIKRHGCTNTYDHSVRVALEAEKLARQYGEDPDAAFRAGLLHDFCLADYHQKEKPYPELYCFYHPKNAIENSKRFGITPREANAIRTHMFPLGRIPTTRLGWIVCAADSIAATKETKFGIKYFFPPKNKDKNKALD